MAKPTVKVEMELNGWANGWTDVSADVMVPAGIRATRGIHAQHPLARVADVGTMSFDLNNSAKNSHATARYYNPGFGGRYIIGSRVRLRMNADIALLEADVLALGPSGWYRADQSTVDGSGNASAVLDKSGNSRALSQGTASKRPAVVTNALNGQTVWRFNGTAGMSLLSGVSMATLLGTNAVGLIVVVLKMNPAATGLNILVTNNTSVYEASMFFQPSALFTSQVYDGASRDASITSPAGGTAGQIVWWRHDSIQVQIAASNGDDAGFISAPCGAPNIATTAFCIGDPNSPGNPSKVDIAEVIAFPTAFAEASRQTIIRYLDARYGLGITETSLASGIKWSGYVASAEPTPGLYSNDRVVHVQCSDWMDHAQRAQLTGTAVQTSKTSDQILTTLLAAMPVQPEGGLSFAVGPYTYAYGLDLYRQSSMAIASEFQKLMQSEWPSILFIAPAGKLKSLIAPTGTSANDFPNGYAMTFAATDLDDITFRSVRESHISDLKGTMSPRTVDAGNVVLFQLTTSQLITHNGGTFKFQARYTDPTQRAARVGGKSMVVPVATTDYTANTAANASGTDLTASIGVAVTFGSDSAEVTLTNNHATLDAYVGLGQTVPFQLRGIGIYTYQQIIIEVVKETGSLLQQFGQNLQQFDMSYQSDATKANYVVVGMATYWQRDLNAAAAINRPEPIVKINASGKDVTFLRNILELDIASAIQVSEPVNAPLLSEVGCYIMAIDYEIDGTGELRVTYTTIRPGHRPNDQ